MKREALDFARLQCVIELRKLVNANPHEPRFDAGREALRLLDMATRERAFAAVETKGAA